MAPSKGQVKTQRERSREPAGIPWTSGFVLSPNKWNNLYFQDSIQCMVFDFLFRDISRFPMILSLGGVPKPYILNSDWWFSALIETIVISIHWGWNMGNPTVRGPSRPPQLSSCHFWLQFCSLLEHNHQTINHLSQKISGLRVYICTP
jgi:hypothetical protein